METDSDTPTRKWKRILALVCVALLLLPGLFASCQCNKSEGGAQEVKKEDIGTQENGTEEARTGAKREEVEEGVEEEEKEEEIPATGGISEFDLEEKSIGAGGHISDLKVTGISWADHGEYFRIVFEFAKSGGGEVTAVPNCHTWYAGAPGNKEYYKLYITLDDIITYKFDYAPFMAGDTQVNLGDPLVKTMQRVWTADTEPVFFLVTCSYSPAHPGISSRPHRLLYQAHPMRVMLDILKY